MSMSCCSEVRLMILQTVTVPELITSCGLKDDIATKLSLTAVLRRDSNQTRLQAQPTPSCGDYPSVRHVSVLYQNE